MLAPGSELPHHPLLATPSRVLFSARHDRSVLQGSALRASTSVPGSRGTTDLRRLRRGRRRRGYDVYEERERDVGFSRRVETRNDVIAANFIVGLSIILALRDPSTSGNIRFDVQRQFLFICSWLFDIVQVCY